MYLIILKKLQIKLNYKTALAIITNLTFVLKIGDTLLFLRL